LSWLAASEFFVEHTIVLSVIVYVLRQNCRAAGWRWDSVYTVPFF
jgi:hypothetical protein